MKWIVRDDADYLLAEINSEILGFLNIQQSTRAEYPIFKEHLFALIENAVVDSKYRGKGIGTLLFNAATDWARNHGLRYVQISVWCANKGAQQFYIEQGFQPMTQKLELDLSKKTQNKTLHWIASKLATFEFFVNRKESSDEPRYV